MYTLLREKEKEDGKETNKQRKEEKRMRKRQEYRTRLAVGDFTVNQRASNFFPAESGVGFGAREANLVLITAPVDRGINLVYGFFMELKVSFLTWFSYFYGSLTWQEHLGILKHLGRNEEHRGRSARPRSLVKEAVFSSFPT